MFKNSILAPLGAFALTVFSTAVRFVRLASIAIAMAFGVAVGGLALVGLCVLGALLGSGHAFAATVDFAPLASFAWDLVSPLLPPVILALVLALAPKFPIVATLIHAVDARQLENYIAVAIQGGAARLEPYASQYTKFQIQNELAAQAATWLVEQTPQRLARLGITPEALLDRVLPYVPGHDAYRELVKTSADAAPVKAAA